MKEKLETEKTESYYLIEANLIDEFGFEIGSGTERLSEFLWPIDSNAQQEEFNKRRRSLFIVELALVLRFEETVPHFYKGSLNSPSWRKEAGEIMEKEDLIYRELLGFWEEHFDSPPEEGFTGSEFHNVVRRVYVQNSAPVGAERLYQEVIVKPLMTPSVKESIETKKSQNLEKLRQVYEEREGETEYKVEGEFYAY